MAFLATFQPPGSSLPCGWTRPHRLSLQPTFTRCIISCFRNSLFPEKSFVWQEIKSSTQSPRTGGFQLNPISTEIPIDSARELFNRFFLLLFDAKKWRGEADHPSFQKVNGCNSCDEKGPFGTPLSFFCLRSQAIQDVKSLRISISYYIENV